MNISTILQSEKIWNVFNLMEESIILVDLNFKIILANNSALCLTGYLQSELNEITIFKLLKEQDGSELLRETFFTRDWKRLRMKIVPKDTHAELGVLLTGTYIISKNNIKGIAFVMRDMTKVDELLFNLSTRNKELDETKNQLERQIADLKKASSA